ncbi:unnamed protein product [Thelazia callipaeda]|uniref:CHK domain-containing protein n=1 Tax=Thelazia callipaeda TaxID=103827 RepID=A0A0N5D0B8_THECL|nr:unnamed protein product [Thelazia callipaeda]
MMDITVVLSKLIGLKNPTATDIHFTRNGIISFTLKARQFPGDTDSAHWILFAIRSRGPKKSSEYSMVVTELSKLHAHCLNESDPESRRRMQNNTFKVLHCVHGQTDYDNELDINEFIIKYGQYQAFILFQLCKLRVALNATNSEPPFSIRASQVEKYHVLCHGFLTYDKVTYTEDGLLIRISNWEDVHIGNVCEDLTFMLITSTSAEIRRQHYMLILRHYYYSLVDLYRPQFNIRELQELFLQLHKSLVFKSLSFVISLLNSNANDELKSMIARRWETAVEDAVRIQIYGIL